MTHDWYRARGWVGGWRVGASKGSQKSSSEEGQQACASRQLLPPSQPVNTDKMLLPTTSACCRQPYCIVGRCAAYMAPWH